jgi:hypothetical protein
MVRTWSPSSSLNVGTPAVAVKCELWYWVYQGDVDEDWSFLEYDAVLIGKYLPTFPTSFMNSWTPWTLTITYSYLETLRLRAIGRLLPSRIKHLILRISRCVVYNNNKTGNTTVVVL